jgi:hypothetical protein
MPHISLFSARQCEGLPPISCERVSKTSRIRRGLTLVEVLIATTITILMLAALAEGFKRVSDSIADNRAALEVSNRLRGVSLRLKEDLENVTVPLTPPLDAMSGQGYFEYFEGPMCDYTMAERFGDKTSSDPTTFAPATRYGDFDDVLMLTSRATNTWFTGKVPRFVRLVARGITPTFPDDLAPEVIASQYAEIIWFARPHDDPALPNAPGSPVAYDNDLDGAPQLVKLHRRVLLIRPDLNTPQTINSATVSALPSYTGAGNWMRPVKNALVGMHLPHQQCDLSLRRVVDSSGTLDYVAANSLDDLASRQNRFAHVVQTVQSGVTSMPLLALENAYAFASGPSPVRNTVLNNALPGLGNMNGPLHSAFVLQDRSDPSLVLNGVAGNLLYENRIGEDVIASFCVGFDLQAFDPLVPLLYLRGADGLLSGGAAGTDDIIVSPSDPGYTLAMTDSFASNGANLAGTGAFVNLGWARHVFNEVTTPAALVTGMSNSTLPFESSFSGLSLSNISNGNPPYSDSLYRSGLFFQNPSFVGAAAQWGQMTYDTWTNAYEVDGILQSDTTRFAAGNYYSGTLNTTNPVTGAWRATADLGRDGIDNNSDGGADDPEEWETSPPFPSPLRSVRALIRMEEPDTRQLFQQTVTVEFVSR